MYCKKCGKNVKENISFCPYCGEKIGNNIESIKNDSDQIEVIEESIEDSNKESINETKNNIQIDIPNNNETTATIENNTDSIASNKKQPNSVQSTNINNEILNSSVNNNQEYTPNNSKKNNNIPFIIVLVILSLIIIGLVIFIFINILNNSSDNTSKIEKETVEVEKEEGNKSTPTNIDTSNKITIDDYEFIIPNGYKTSQESGVCLIMDDEKSVIFELDAVANESFSDYILHSEDLKTEFINKGFVVNGYTTKTVGNIDYLLYDVTKDGVNMNLYVAKIDEFDIAIGAIVISPSTTYDNALVKLSTILSTADGKDKTSSSTFTKKIPSIDNNKLIKELK